MSIYRFLQAASLRSLRSLKGKLIVAGVGAILLSAMPVRAAERIYFYYGPFERSLTVRSLEEFAKTGQVNPDLQYYFKLAKATEETKAEFRLALSKNAEISPVLLSRFFYSGLGEDILDRLGDLIENPGRINGKYALRSALVLSAVDTEGLSLVNVLRKYPTNLYIDVKKLLEIGKDVDQVVQATTFFTQEMAKLSVKEASTEPIVDFSAQPDLRQPGPYATKETRWQLKDASRDRSFYVIVHQPTQARPGQTPVLIFSHGLASSPEDFAARAKYLASYGYVVAIPQHPGSDHLQAQKLKQGLSKFVFLTSDFVDRPRDISYVIDELQRRNQSEFAGRLNLQSVGVVGHSFGGYTALAVAGATIDFEHLKQDCDRPSWGLNTSLLLQCRALELPRQTYNFRDPRVQAVFVANPVDSSIFGPKGIGQIQIPVLLGAGTYDPVTPAVYEQAKVFPWLTTPNKYLLLVEGQAHVNFANLDAGITQAINSVSGLTLPSPDLIGSYANALLLAFFETHLANNPQYRPYIQPAYAAYLSQDEEFKLFMLSGASDSGFKQAIAAWRARN